VIRNTAQDESKDGLKKAGKASGLRR